MMLRLRGGISRIAFTNAFGWAIESVTSRIVAADRETGSVKTAMDAVLPGERSGKIKRR